MVEVIFLKGRDPLSRFIMWWTGGRFCHCGIRLWRCLVIDIDLIHGVRARFDPWARDTLVVQVAHDPIRVLHSLYLSRWTQYSLWEGLRAKLPCFPDDPHRWNCAELVVDILSLTGPERCLTPDDVYALLTQKRRVSYETRIRVHRSVQL